MTEPLYLHDQTGVLFTVHGEAQPAGSKKAFVNRKTGRAQIVDDAKKSRPWKAIVTDAAVQAMNGAPPMDGPLRAEFTFYVKRPAGHYGTGRNARVLKPSAPRFPTVRPDLLKLGRSVEDALTDAGVYRDDSQIRYEVLRKNYADECVPHVVIEIVPDA